MSRAHPLDLAATVLGGKLTRTTTSVVGTRRGETVIFSASPWGLSAAVLVQSSKMSFTIEPKGWLLKRGLRVEGTPTELVMRVLDGPVKDWIVALAPVEIRLTPNGIHLERSGGSLEEITAACDLVATLAQRVRAIESERPISAWRLALR